MTPPKTLPLAVAGAVAVFTGRILYAAHRPDLPSYDNYDTSGALGDPGLPGLRLVAIGDSSITAPGARSVDDAFIRRIAHSLTDRYFVQLHALAVGGSKARDIIDNQLEEAVAIGPDLVVLSVGANDAIRGVTPQSFRIDLEEITGRFVELGASVAIVGVGDLGSIPRLPRFLRWYLTYRSGVFDAVSAEVAASYPSTVKADVRGQLSRDFWEDPRMFSGDLFHASSYGHERFGHHVSVAVERALASR